MLFKLFYAPARPLLVCEGKTDNLFLTLAIKHRSAFHPTLVTTGAGNTKQLSVRFFKYEETRTSQLLGITGGSGKLAKLIHEYLREAVAFVAPAPQHPVIIVADFDDGMSSIKPAVEEHAKRSITGNEQYVRIARNLYLVTTPLKAGATSSSIEDFFPDELKAVKLGGKTFSKKNNADSDVHYGKHIFGQKVVLPRAGTIDFSGFAPLLTNIEAVIADYKKQVELSATFQK